MTELKNSIEGLFPNQSFTTANNVKSVKEFSNTSCFALITSLIFFSAIAWSNSGIVSLVSDVYGQVPSSSHNDSSLSAKKLSIDLNSVSFSPLDDQKFNQLRVSINYHTLNPLMVNTPMAGTMKVYDTNDALIKTSSVPKGYIVGQSGQMHFATSFADKTVQNVKAEVYMTDTLGHIVSNILSIQTTFSAQ
jgi:hypothetical protein